MPDAPKKTLADLIAVMAALRTPVTGCPWDLEQSFASIAPYTIEEAYEVADAIERGDRADLKEELGDLLLQVVYHARLAEEEQAFDFTDVANGITTKMIRRHPHVFGDAVARSAGMAKDAWERIKSEERALKSGARDRVPGSGARGAESLSPDASASNLQIASASNLQIASASNLQIASASNMQLASASNMQLASASLLADVPVGLPGLTRAVKLQEKAARVGFDWPSLEQVFGKMREELAELEEVVGRGQSHGSDPEARIEEEFGDLLFVMANVARHLKIDPETALRRANGKFVRRFRFIEERLAEKGKTPAQSDLAEMDALWDEAKAAEKFDHS